MKRLIFVFLAFSAVTAQAQEMATALRPNYQGPVLWKVGDHMEYEIDVVPIGKVGTMTLDVTKEEAPGVWLKQSSLITGSPDVQEMLVDRTTGAVLKYLKNGQAATYTDEGVTITSQDDENVTVPAGTFDSTHFVESTTDIAHVDVWVNASATAIDGMLKTVISSGSTIQLVSFARGPR